VAADGPAKPRNAKQERFLAPFRADGLRCDFASSGTPKGRGGAFNDRGPGLFMSPLNAPVVRRPGVKGRSPRGEVECRRRYSLL